MPALGRHHFGSAREGWRRYRLRAAAAAAGWPVRRAPDRYPGPVVVSPVSCTRRFPQAVAVLSHRAHHTQQSIVTNGATRQAAGQTGSRLCSTCQHLPAKPSTRELYLDCTSLLQARIVVLALPVILPKPVPRKASMMESEGQHISAAVRTSSRQAGLGHQEGQLPAETHLRKQTDHNPAASQGQNRVLSIWGGCTARSAVWKEYLITTTWDVRMARPPAALSCQEHLLTRVYLTQYSCTTCMQRLARTQEKRHLSACPVRTGLSK